MTTHLTTRKENKLELNGNLITGDTFPVRDYLKQYCDAKWDAANKGWRVNVEKLNGLLGIANSIGLRIANAPEAKKVTGSNGWCDKCKSWCYGDCQAH